MNIIVPLYLFSGMFFIIPCVDDFVKVDLRIFTYNIPPQEVRFVWPSRSEETLPNYIWAASWQNQQYDCAPSEDSDQPGPPPVWSESSLCAQWVAKDPSFLHADSEDSDQTGVGQNMLRKQSTFDEAHQKREIQCGTLETLLVFTKTKCHADMQDCLQNSTKMK